MTRALETLDLRGLLTDLQAQYGPIGWWPAQTPFELMVGAVLVQHTTWRQAERSLDALREAGMLEPGALLACGEDALTALIRPSGFQRAKQRALRSIAGWVLAEDAFAPERFVGTPTEALRADLLALTGVGPETADVMLLYVFDRRRFVSDTYARRLLDELGFDVPSSYEATQRILDHVVERSDLTVDELAALHGLIDEHGKHARGARLGEDAGWLPARPA